MKTILKYTLPNGKIPFDEWFTKQDKMIKAKVLVRLERVKNGLFGQCRSLKKGVSELKFITGERIYFAQDGEKIILLLTAGNKQRQSCDITTAEMYFEDYKERCKDNDNRV